MGTQVGFIYGTQSKILRRIVVPTSDAELNGHVGKDESILIADRSGGISVERGKTLIQQATAVAPPSSRCVVVVNGNVTGVVSADPSFDKIAGATLIASDIAGVGWQWDGSKFIAPPADVPGSPKPTASKTA